MPVAAIDPERAYPSTLFAFVVGYLVHRIKETAVRMHGHERWIDGFGRKAEGRKPASCRIETITIDAFALAALLRIGTDINEIFRIVFGGRSGSNG